MLGDGGERERRQRAVVSFPRVPFPEDRVRHHLLHAAAKRFRRCDVDQHADATTVENPGDRPGILARDHWQPLRHGLENGRPKGFLQGRMHEGIGVFTEMSQHVCVRQMAQIEHACGETPASGPFRCRTAGLEAAPNQVQSTIGVPPEQLCKTGQQRLGILPRIPAGDSGERERPRGTHLLDGCEDLRPYAVGNDHRGRLERVAIDEFLPHVGRHGREAGNPRNQPVAVELFVERVCRRSMPVDLAG